MGTNDIRLNKGSKANVNMITIAEKTNKESTIIAQIPPMNIGHEGSEEYADMQLDRGILNRVIKNKTQHYISMTEIENISRIEGTMIQKDGYHLTTKGGEAIAKQMANLITASTRKQICQHNKGHPQQIKPQS